ncbi:MAG: type II toxin-antitoxin system RelE family toxin [Wenzhouxiangella sp.]
MASYSIEFRRSVVKDLRCIPSKDIQRILQRIDSLADDPRPPGCEKLSGLERYRLRQGNYRILYEILDERVLIVVVKIGHRRSVFQGR